MQMIIKMIYRALYYRLDYASNSIVEGAFNVFSRDHILIDIGHFLIAAILYYVLR